MSRTTTKIPQKQPSARFKAHIERIAEKTLHKLERRLDHIDELDADSHDMLFGTKDSLVSTLVAITDLVTELGDDMSAFLSPEKDDDENAIDLTEDDIALVKSFIARSQTVIPASSVKLANLTSQNVVQKSEVKNRGDP